MKLDEYEKELIENEERILSRAKAPADAEKERLRLAARNTLNKDKRINIRMSSRDLGALQRKATRYGMPYQTLISSILHRYVSGDLRGGAFESAGEAENKRTGSSKPTTGKRKAS